MSEAGTRKARRADPGSFSRPTFRRSHLPGVEKSDVQIQAVFHGPLFVTRTCQESKSSTCRSRQFFTAHFWHVSSRNSKSSTCRSRQFFTAHFSSFRYLPKWMFLMLVSLVPLWWANFATWTVRGQDDMKGKKGKEDTEAVTLSECASADSPCGIPMPTVLSNSELRHKRRVRGPMRRASWSGNLWRPRRVPGNITGHASRGPQATKPKRQPQEPDLRPVQCRMSTPRRPLWMLLSLLATLGGAGAIGLPGNSEFMFAFFQHCCRIGEASKPGPAVEDEQAQDAPRMVIQPDSAWIASARYSLDDRDGDVLSETWSIEDMYRQDRPRRLI